MAEMKNMKKPLKKQENQVYRCTWRKLGRRFVLTCTSPVFTTVKSEDLSDAENQLFSKIIALTGDGEPCFQFVPDLPRPEVPRNVSQPEYHCIRANDRVEWDIVDGMSADDLWQGGVCKKCKCGCGQRSKVARTISTLPRYDLVLFHKDRNAAIMYSERVLKHLLPHLKRGVELIPVNTTSAISKKIKTKYFELSFAPEMSVAIPKERQPASRNGSDISGWRCKVCGRFMAQWWNQTIGSVAYGLERSQSKKPVLLVQNGPVLSLAVSKSVHDALCADKSIRGFVSERVAMLDSDEVLSLGELKNLKLRQIEA